MVNRPFLNGVHAYEPNINGIQRIFQRCLASVPTISYLPQVISLIPIDSLAIFCIDQPFGTIGISESQRVFTCRFAHHHTCHKISWQARPIQQFLHRQRVSIGFLGKFKSLAILYTGIGMIHHHHSRKEPHQKQDTEDSPQYPV